tara:strand:- start:81664 stop:82773 length:1110 start_codon:yes stop_codon:yes gene_type:complete
MYGEVMKSITKLFICYLFIIVQSFSYEGSPILNGNSPARIQIKSFAKIHTQKFEGLISQYNDNRKNLDYFVGLLKDKDQANFLNGLIKQNRINKLPEIEHRNGVYFLKLEENLITFDIVSVSQGLIYINNNKFDISKGKNLQERAKILSSFLIENKFSYNFFIPEANALGCLGLCIAGLIGGTLLVGGMIAQAAFNIFGESSSLEKLQAMREEIKKKGKKCNDEYKEVKLYTGKLSPYKGITPGYFDSFSLYKKTLEETTEINQEKIEAHMISIVKKEMGDDAPNLDNLSCKEFGKQLFKALDLGSRRISSESMTQAEICSEYRSLSQCIQQFHDAHSSYINNSNRGKKNIYNYRYNLETGKFEGGFSK